MTENGSINLNLRLFLELLIGDIVETVVASFFANRVIYPKRGLGADKTADHQKISCHALTLIETLFRNVFHVKQGAAVKLIPEFGSAANCQNIKPCNTKDYWIQNRRSEEHALNINLSRALEFGLQKCVDIFDSKIAPFLARI